MATSNRISHLNPKTNFVVNSKSKFKATNMRRIVSMAQNQSYWASIEADIETYLKNAIPCTTSASPHQGPLRRLYAWRPASSSGATGAKPWRRRPAVHLMHAAAYTHEHLQLTDRTRSNPAIQHKYGPNIELLTGDRIIPFGMELLAKSVDPTRGNPDRILRVVIEIARATGSLVRRTNW